MQEATSMHSAAKFHKICQGRLQNNIYYSV